MVYSNMMRGGVNYVLLHAGETKEPDEVKAPKAPDDWVEPDSNTSKRGHTFEKIVQPRRME